MILAVRVKYLLGVMAAMAALCIGMLASADEANKTAAQETQIVQAVAFIQNFTEESNAILNNETSPQTARITAFEKVLSNTLAAQAIGNHMVTGIKKKFSDEQYQRYKTIFPDYITQRFAKQFSEQFAKIVKQPMSVEKTRAIRNDVYVGSKFNRTNGSPIAIIWRVRQQKDGALQILDIRVAGVSQWKAIRDEFTSIVKSQGVDALLDLLETEISSKNS